MIGWMTIIPTSGWRAGHGQSPHSQKSVIVNKVCIGLDNEGEVTDKSNMDTSQFLDDNMF